MKTHLILFFTLLLFHFNMNAQDFKAPNTPEKNVTHDLHGTALTDPYEWLEDKTDPEVKTWTRAQHDATVDFVNQNIPPIDGLKEEIASYVDRDYIGPVSLEGDKQFFYVKKKGEQQYKLYTKTDSGDELLFDPMLIDPSGKTALAGISYSFDTKKAAIGVQTAGAEINTYYIIDIETKQQEGKPIENLRGFSWTKDGKHAYITKGSKEMLEQQIPLKTYLHKIGDDPANDQFIIAPEDAKNFAGISDSKYSDITFLYRGDFYSNTLSIKKTGSNDEPVEMFSSKESKAWGTSIGDKIYLHTNHEAPNFKLMLADVKNPGFEHWTEIIPEKETVMESYVITDDYILIQDKKDVLSRLMVYDLNGKFIKEMEIPEVGNISGTSYHRESNTLFVTLATFTAPTRIYKVNMEDFSWSLFFERESPLNTENITAKIEFYPSKDGTKIPIFIVHRKDIKLDGSNPCLINGYGGFNIGISPSYIGLNTAFINRGGVFAKVGIRGGDEYGEQWHLDGMMFKKQNTFDDFIAGAEYLIAQGYTNSNKLAAKGGSNGGLLMGAVMTQRPDLFKAIWCAVPLLDMVRFHKFLIARYWIPEYGDPEKEEDFRNILTYSPYHNIRSGIDFPVSLITAGENDTRVDPLHAKKFVAALQNNTGQKNPILLYMDFDSGHGSGKSTEATINDFEFKMRFIMHQLGMN